MSVFPGTSLAWVADNDEDASLVLATRYPDAPNLGDITRVDWSSVEPVDIVLGGFPCQDVSQANQMDALGMVEGSRSGVWSHIAKAIGVLRPPLVFLENVRGLLSAKADCNMELCPGCMGDAARERPMRALGAVLGDLASLGYDAEWQCVLASDVAAPHRRERVFILGWSAAAHPYSTTGYQWGLSAPR